MDIDVFLKIRFLRSEQGRGEETDGYRDICGFGSIIFLERKSFFCYRDRHNLKDEIV